jgi:predicted Zn-dependent peptidase
LDRLDSGQRLITERLDHLRSISLGFWIPVGSRDETRELAGVTHFIEHLLFKGTERYSAVDIAQIFDALGGELNAATSREYVVVYGRFLDEHLPVALDVLVDMLRAPAFADLDREREVILEEIAMYEDSPQDLIHDLLSQTMFDDHPLGWPVLGSRESIGAATEEQIRDYHGERFRFEHMVVSAAGNVDHGLLLGLLRQHAHPAEPQRVREAQPAELHPKRSFQTKETEQMHICIGGPGLPRNHERRYILSVLDSLLGGSLSSRLFQEVREKRGLAYSIYSFVSMYKETGIFGIYFGCRPDRVEQVMNTVSEELRAVRRAAIEMGELQRAKEHLKGRVILGLESTSSRMTRLGKGLLTDSEILGLDEIAERIEQVSVEDVREMAEELLDPECLTVVGIGVDEEVFQNAVPEHGLPEPS